MSVNLSYATDEGVRKIDDSAWSASIMAGEHGLRSRIFAGNAVLNDILRHDGIDTEEFFSRRKYKNGDHIELLELALKIVVPQMEGISQSEISAVMSSTISREYSSRTNDWILLFQKGFNTTYSEEIDESRLPFKELEETGILDSATLYFIDRELVEIKYYDVDKEKVIHNNSRAVRVDEFTVVSSSTSGFWSEPSESALIEDLTLNFNDKVFILQVLQNKDWCYVMLENGKRGYLKTVDIWTDSAMPDPGAKLFRIPAGSDGELLRIVKNNYTLDTEDEQLGVDFRFYSNLLMYVNNPEGGTTKKRIKLNLNTGRFDLEDATPIDAAIYPENNSVSWKVYLALLFVNPALPIIVGGIEKSWEALESAIASKAGTGWDHWRNALTRSDKLIWLPSKNFAHTLRRVVNTGSISGNIREAFQMFNTRSFNALKPALDEWWPPGYGLRIDFGLGATFAAPVGIDGDYYAYIYRDVEGTVGKSSENKSYRFKMYRRGWGRAGFDTGAGVGAFVSMGGLGKDTQWMSKKSHYGVGAGAAAEIFAGARALVQEEYIFDLDESTDLAFMFFMATQADFFERLNNAYHLGSDMVTAGFPMPRVSLSATAAILKTFEFLGVDIYDYLTKFKVEGGLVGTGAAGGSIGLRFGDKTDVSGTVEKWNHKEDSKAPYDRGTWGTPRVVTSLLGISMGLDISAEFCIGLELEFPKGFTEEEVYGYRIPEEVIASVYADVEFMKGGNVPVLSPLLNWIPNAGGGIKGSMTFTSNHVPMHGSGPVFSTSMPEITFYSKVGELDFYDHRPASGADLALSLSMSQNGVLPVLPTTVTGFMNSLEPAKIEKRMAVGQLIFDPGFARFNRFRLKLSRLIKHNNQIQGGFVSEGWVTFKFTVDNDKFASVAQRIATDLVVNQGKELKDVSNYLLEVLNGKTPSSTRPVLIDDLFAILFLEKAELHFEVGAGLAGGFKASEGAKVRIRGNVTGYVVYHIDITEAILELVEELTQERFILILMRTVHPALEYAFPINELPTSNN